MIKSQFEMESLVIKINTQMLNKIALKNYSNENFVHISEKLKIVHAVKIHYSTRKYITQHMRLADFSSCCCETT